MTTTAKDNQFDFNVLMVIGLPVIVGVWEWLGYAAIKWNVSVRTCLNRWADQRGR